jgi:two-component system chemotaxis response regulator CheY
MANILVVDDAYANHRLIGIMLKRNSHTITSAYNGLEALNYLVNSQVDMLITDINMPIMDGLTLLEHLRADGKHHDMPVIVITASGQEYLQRMAAERGASAFLTQPFSSWELNRAVSDCLPALV